MAPLQKIKKKKSEILRFQRISLENWRNFIQVNVALGKRAFLVGPNASGKSNFLDVFRFLHDIASVGGGFQEAVRKRGGVKALRSLAARRFPDIAIRISVGSENSPDLWTYDLHFSHDNQQRPIIIKERVKKEGKLLLKRPNEKDREDVELLTQTHLEQVNSNRKFRELADFFASVRYLHIVPQLIREPDRSIGRKKDPYGGDFLEQLAGTPESTRKAQLHKVREALCIAVPKLKEIKLWRDDRGTPHLRGKYQHWRPQGAWQTEDQFSDGTLRLLGLLWAVLEEGGPLLLEEPELSLHPEVVRNLPQMFARVQSRTGRQILLSTHSADLLRDEGIGLDEVLLMIPEAEGTEVRAASQLEEAENLLEGGVSLADIVLPRTRPEKAEQLSLFQG